jgi:RHS repeat-associated protein
VLATLDTTLLENGYHELRVEAEDLDGNTTSIIRPVRVSGQAKVGVVQLSFVDAAIPVAGIPVTVVRTYDSRRKDVRGDFGYGWSLDIKRGSAAHNRPVGDGLSIYTGSEDFSFPCQRTAEQRSHFTEIRLSDREWYIFRPALANLEGVSGHCAGDVFFDFVDGTQAGAQLEILGDNEVISTGYDPLHPFVAGTLVYAANATETFDPKDLRLTLPDGRVYDVNIDTGIRRVQDRNGNALFFQDNGVYAASGKGLTFERDAQGRVTRLIDPSGRTVEYGYDLNGDLVHVTNEIAENTQFIYKHSAELEHHLDKVIGPAGDPLAKLDYDAAGRLVKACDADKGCTQSSYDLSQRTVVQLDATQVSTQYAYDLSGNVTSQTDGLGHTTSFQYDGNDNVTRAEGPDGSVATYTYDSNSNLLTRVLPHEANEPAADFTYQYAYNARNDRTSVTLPSGGVIAYEYDAAGNQTVVKDGDGNAIEARTYNADGTVETRTDRFGTTSYQGYVDGQPMLIVDPHGAQIELEYDNNGRLTARHERGQTTTTSYDDAGRRTAVDYGHGSTVDFEYSTGKADWTKISGPTFGTVTRSFTAKGLLSGWTEPNGDAFVRLYDGDGRVKEEIDALGNRTTYAYDAAGRLDSISDVTLNATTHFERDAAGRVTKTTDALGHETHTAYKLGGRLESTTNARGKTTSFDRTPTSASITDALSRTTVTSLSTYGLPGSTTYPGGASTASSYLGTTRLDGAQQFPTSFEDELERSRDYGYDVKSGLTSASDLAGQNWQYEYTPAAGSGISYDVMSGSVTPSQQDGGASAYQSSGGGTEYRDVATTGGNDGSNFTHLLSQVTSPMGEVTKFERGENGRISKVTYPDGGIRQITYDSKNRPGLIELPQGQVVSLDYDTVGREISRTVYNRDGQALTPTGEFRTLSYGVGDRIEEMEDPTGVTTYSYDSAGRFSGITYPSGASVMYTRDKLDRTTDVRVKPKADAPEIVTHYEYDPNGNLAEITDPNGSVTGFSYDDADRLTQRVLPNGVVTSYSYDDRDRVLSVVHRNASNVVLASVTYVRSPSGEPTKVTREDGSFTDLEYDAALRVKKESEHDANGVLISETQYGYDNDGNRTSKTTLTGNDTYSYSAGFKLDSISHSGGGADDGFQYDGGGRLIGFDRGGVHREINYDSEDRVKRVVDGGIEVERYTFDGAGRRVAVDDGTGTKRFLTAPNRGDGYSSPQAVTDASGNVLATFVYAGEHPIAKITPTGVEYFLGDEMGSVIGKANGAGASVAVIHYDGFGSISSATGTAANIDATVGAEPRFQGMTLDHNTGLYFARARSYDAETGRFLTRDPLSGVRGVPESFHPYTFAANNPRIYRDPSGKVVSEWQIAQQEQRVLDSINEAVTRIWQQVTGRSLTADETQTFRENFGYSIDLGEVRLKKFPYPGARAAYVGGGLVLVDPDEFEGGVQSGALKDYGVLAHELLHMWQYKYRNDLVVAAEVAQAKFDDNAYDFDFDFDLFNPEQPWLVMANFVVAPAERQASIFQACFGTNTPDCNMLRSYISDPSVAHFNSLIEGRGIQ